MKKYIKATIEILSFQEQDVLATSAFSGEDTVFGVNDDLTNLWQ